MRSRVIYAFLSVCLIISLLLSGSAGFLLNAGAVGPDITLTGVTSSFIAEAKNNSSLFYDVKSTRLDKSGVRNIYMLLPCTADAGDLTLTFSDGTSQTVDLSAPKTVSIDGTVYELTAIVSDLPSIHLDIDESQGTIHAMNTDPDHDTLCFGTFRMDVPAKLVASRGWKASYVDPSLEIRGRGNATWTLDKKPYQIKLASKPDLLNLAAR